MPTEIAGITVVAELDAAPLKKALAEIQACTESAAKRMSKALGDVSPELDSLRERVERLDAVIAKSDFGVKKLQTLRESLRQTAASVGPLARELQKLSTLGPAQPRLGQIDLEASSNKVLANEAKEIADALGLLSQGGSNASLVLDSLFGAAAGLFRGGLIGGGIGGGLPLAKRLLDPSFTDQLKAEADELLKNERKLVDAINRFDRGTRLRVEGNNALGSSFQNTALEQIRGLTGEIGDNRRVIAELLEKFRKARDKLLGTVGAAPGRASQTVRDDAFDELAGRLNKILPQAQQWSSAQQQIADSTKLTLDAFCRIEEKTRSIRANLQGLPVFGGSEGPSGDGSMGGPAFRTLPPIPRRRPELRALPPIPRRRPEEFAALADTLREVERAEETLGPALAQLRAEVAGLGETGEAVFDIFADGLRGVAFEGQGLLATLEGIAERVRDLALDEVLFPFLKKELGGIFAAGEEGPGAAGDKVFGPAAEGLGALAESALGGADALRETGLATAGVTSASGAAAGALVNELTAGALQTALATATQSAASQGLTAALAAVTAAANAASVALQGLTVSAGGGGGGAGGILGSLLGTATGGGFDPGVGPGGLGFLKFGGPRAAGGPMTPGQAFLVGERGPELVVPQIPTRVLSNADTRALLGGGGAAPRVTVVLNNTFNGRFTAAERADNVRMSEAMARSVLAEYERDLERGGPRAQRSGRRAKR